MKKLAKRLLAALLALTLLGAMLPAAMAANETCGDDCTVSGCTCGAHTGAPCDCAACSALQSITADVFAVTLRPTEMKFLAITASYPSCSGKANEAVSSGLIFNSSNNTVATVDTAGRITGVADGTTSILVRLSSNSAIFCTVIVNVVSIPALAITTQPVSANYIQNAFATALTVTATGGTAPYSYQWYEASTNSNATGTAISGETGANYLPSTATVGMKYYYCAVTDANNTTVKSNVATITVTAMPYTVTLSLDLVKLAVGGSTGATATIRSNDGALYTGDAKIAFQGSNACIVMDYADTPYEGVAYAAVYAEKKGTSTVTAVVTIGGITYTSNTVTVKVCAVPPSAETVTHTADRAGIAMLSAADILDAVEAVCETIPDYVVFDLPTGGMLYKDGDSTDIDNVLGTEKRYFSEKPPAPAESVIFYAGTEVAVVKKSGSEYTLGFDAYFLDKDTGTLSKETYTYKTSNMTALDGTETGFYTVYINDKNEVTFKDVEADNNVITPDATVAVGSAANPFGMTLRVGNLEIDGSQENVTAYTLSDMERMGCTDIAAGDYLYVYKNIDTGVFTIVNCGAGYSGATLMVGTGGAGGYATIGAVYDGHGEIFLAIGTLITAAQLEADLTEMLDADSSKATIAVYRDSSTLADNSDTLMMCGASGDNYATWYVSITSSDRKTTTRYTFSGPYYVTCVQPQSATLQSAEVERQMLDGVCFRLADGAEEGSVSYTAYDVSGAPIAMGRIVIKPATAPPAVSAGSARVKAGKTVQIPLKLENNPGFADLSVEIAWDESVMALESTEPTAFGGILTTSQTVQKNPYLLNWTSIQDLTYNGTLVLLNFTVREDAPEGEYPVTVRYYRGIDGANRDGEDVNFDENHTAVPFAYESGTVTVLHYTPGDTTGDDKVTSRDAVYILQYLAGWDVEGLVPAAMDVDGNGRINSWDAILLLRYIAGWDIALH